MSVGRLPARAEPGAASQRLAGVEQALGGPLEGARGGSTPRPRVSHLTSPQTISEEQTLSRTF